MGRLKYNLFQNFKSLFFFPSSFKAALPFFIDSKCYFSIEWEKIFTNKETDKGFISKIHKHLT